MRFDGLRPAPSPDGLKQRVLDAAAGALAAERSPGIWERLWISRPLRVAWALTTFGLLFAHAALSLGPGGPQWVESRDQAEELHEVLALPNVEISPRAERLSMGEPEKRNENEVKS